MASVKHFWEFLSIIVALIAIVIVHSPFRTFCLGNWRPENRLPNVHT